MTFTVGELEIIKGVIRGWSNREIAKATGYTVDSVRVQLSRIYRKAGIWESAKRVTLAVRAVTEGWVNGHGN